MNSHPNVAWTKIDRNVQGQSRMVCNHYVFLTDSEKRFCKYGINQADDMYTLAASRAKDLGGKKFNNRQFGGGIVFACSDYKDLEDKIAEIMDTLPC